MEKRINVIIDAEFKKKVQVKCLKEGVTLTDIVTDFLSYWLKGDTHGITKREQSK